jgi:N-acetylglucosaminyldiphosphoundecaprenol N-acetyl-beta-D-mannosaminyltransferase
MERFVFFGVQVNAVNLQMVVEEIRNHDFSKTGYVSFPDAYVITQAAKNEDLREILNHSLLTVPDGKMTELYARRKGYSNVSTVSGYWLCKNLLSSALTHYFLGSTPERINKIKANIEINFSEAKVLGYSSAPFESLSFFKDGNILEKELEEINKLQPDLIWIGLSSPKQDFLMKHHVPLLKRGIMLGVGAVFDYLSGDVKKSPEWIKKIGLRWLWRFLKEPKRMLAKDMAIFKMLFVLKFGGLFKRKEQ